MNTYESYVSLEIAKLLKEKGFDETCYACYEYFSSSITMYSGQPFEYKGEPVHNSKNIIKCPTLQMAMKWLREVHNKQCDVSYDIDLKWFIQIIDLKEPVEYNYLENGTGFKSYEKACEAAIKYCLENLI